MTDTVYLPEDDHRIRKLHSAYKLIDDAKTLLSAGHTPVTIVEGHLASALRQLVIVLSDFRDPAIYEAWLEQWKLDNPEQVAAARAENIAHLTEHRDWYPLDYATWLLGGDADLAKRVIDGEFA